MMCCGLCVLLFFFYVFGDHRDLPGLTHSFPTRRSSDLPSARDLLDAVQMREQVREADFVGADSVRRGRVHARAALGSTRCEEACAMRSAIHRSISRLSQAETAADRESVV